MPANLKNSGLEKVHFHSNSKERQCQKMFNYCTMALISHASKIMLKILQTRIQQYMNQELPDVRAGFRKGRGTREKITNICWIIEKAREFQKIIYICFTDCVKAFDHVEHNKLWKIIKEMGIPDHLTCFLRNMRQVKAASINLDVLICRMGMLAVKDVTLQSHCKY